MKSAVPAFGLVLLLSAAPAFAEDARTIVAKSGETIEIRPVYGSLHCKSILVAPPEVEVLQGPPELKLSVREDMVTPLNCLNKIKGGFVVATVGNVKQPVEGKLIFHVKYKTMDGVRQSGYIYNVALVGGTPRQVQSRKPKQEATSGTAFFVSDDGDALTNAHVVEDCQQIRVAGAAARLIARDSPNDLALLKTQLHPAQWANWRQSVKLGEDIVAYGFPLAGRLSSSGNVVTGNVTALVGLGDDSRFLQISAPIQPGNSGGPLFDRNGSVVGVVVAKLNAVKIASETGDIPQNVNFAIKSSVAVAFLDAHRVPHSENDAPPLPLSTPEIATQAQALTAQVLCTQ